MSQFLLQLDALCLNYLQKLAQKQQTTLEHFALETEDWVQAQKNLYTTKDALSTEVSSCKLEYTLYICTVICISLP